MDVGRLQLAPVSAEDCQEETGRSSSRDGQEEEAGGCPKLCFPLKLTSCVDSKSSSSTNSTPSFHGSDRATTCLIGEGNRKRGRGRREELVAV